MDKLLIAPLYYESQREKRGKANNFKNNYFYAWRVARVKGAQQRTATKNLLPKTIRSLRGYVCEGKNANRSEEVYLVASTDGKETRDGTRNYFSLAKNSCPAGVW